LGLEVGDFGVAQAVGEGGVWVDFLLVLGNGARRGCCFVSQCFVCVCRHCLGVGILRGG
jgi:hypothetical protein